MKIDIFGGELTDAVVKMYSLLQAWLTPKHEHVRKTFEFAFERSIKAWAVAQRVAKNPRDAVHALERRMEAHWRRVQSTPPSRGILKVRCTEPLQLSNRSRHLDAVEVCAKQIMGASESDAGVGADTPTWRAPCLLGKVCFVDGHDTDKLRDNKKPAL